LRTIMLMKFNWMNGSFLNFRQWVQIPS